MGENFYFATISTRDCSLWDMKRGVNEEWVEQKKEESLKELQELAKKIPSQINEIFEDFIQECLDANDEMFTFIEEGIASPKDIVLLARHTITEFYENLTKGCVGYQNIWHADGKMRVQVICGDISCEVDERIMTIIRFEYLPREILKIGGWD